MTKVQVMPGPCGNTATITAEKLVRRIKKGEKNVRVTVQTNCAAHTAMMEALGDTFDAYEVCLVRPGKGPFNAYAGEHFPVHVGCPVISAITKCVEAECGLALPRDVSIRFLKDEEG